MTDTGTIPQYRNLIKSRLGAPIRLAPGFPTALVLAFLECPTLEGADNSISDLWLEYFLAGAVDFDRILIRDFDSEVTRRSVQFGTVSTKLIPDNQLSEGDL